MAAQPSPTEWISNKVLFILLPFLHRVVSMGSVKQIDDLVVLGRSAPEPIADGRETVCLGGYSESEGWVRLYPTKRQMTELQRWNVVSVPAERDESHDNRLESYKIADSKREWDDLHEKVEVKRRLDRSERIELAYNLAGDCPAELSEQKRSLGLVEVDKIKNIELKETESDTVQHTLDMNPRKGKSDYEYKLYLTYRCNNCHQKTPHKQHTIEWGVYKWWKKSDDKQQVIENLNLKNDDWKKWLFVGNLNHQRTAYIIISILRTKKDSEYRSVIPDENQREITDWE